MSEQSDLNADTQAVAAAVADLQTQSGNISTAVSAIQQWIQNNPDADTSDLDQAVQQLTTAQQSVDGSVSSLQGLASNPGGGTTTT